jgi:hypothetical protein
LDNSLVSEIRCHQMESSSLRLGLVQDTGSYRGIPLELGCRNDAGVRWSDVDWRTKHG